MQEGMNRRLLAVLAHPDDETFGCGGTLAKYASEGVHIALVCATRGEAGEISDSSPATPETLGQVREQELRAACDVLGIKDLFILGYRDSGMADTPDNRNPRAFCRADRDEAVGKVVEIIRRLKPQVVVTFDPTGGYGHPDHITAHHVAKEAFTASGDSTRYAEHLANGLDAHRPHKLYYSAFPRSMFRAFQDALREASIESDFNDMDAEAMGVPDEDITTIVDVSLYGEHKERAALCHRTQIPEDGAFSWIPESVRARFLSAEHLIRAVPPSVSGQSTGEKDLFDGIQI